jgi:hypothetical protein
MQNGATGSGIEARAVGSELLSSGSEQKPVCCCDPALVERGRDREGLRASEARLALALRGVEHSARSASWFPGQDTLRVRTRLRVGVEHAGREPFVRLIEPLDGGVCAVLNPSAAAGLPRCPAT